MLLTKNAYSLNIQVVMLAFTLILLFSGCLPKDPCIYQFVIPIQLSPAIDTFHVGDTIWIESHFSSTMLDKLSGQYFALDQPIFNTEMGFTDIGSNPFVSANEDFELNALEGTVQFVPLYNASVFKVDYRVDSVNNFHLNLKAIPLRHGLFTLHFSSFTDRLVEYLDVSIINGCDPSLAKYYYDTNNGEENNFYLFQLSPDTSVHGFSRNIFDEFGTYNFVVID